MRVRAGLVAAAYAGAMLAPASAAAQSAECAAQPCATGVAAGVDEIWAQAARAHGLKLEFVAALRAFTRAQTGRVGDEADALRASLDAMRRALGGWDRAIGTLETAAAPLRRTADVHAALATAYLDRHRPDEALRELADAARLDPRRADVHTLRAHAYTMVGRPADAARALQAAAAIDPRPTTVYWQAQQWRRAARTPAAGDAGPAAVRPPAGSDAAAAREPARGAEPGATVDRGLPAGQALRQFIALVAAAPGGVVAATQPFERVDLLRQVAGVAPLFPVGLYAAGYAALERGDYREAMSSFAQAVDRDPVARAPSRVRLAAAEAGASLRRGEPGAATIAALRELVAAVPEEAEAHRLLGIAYGADEQHGESAGYFETAVRLDPRDERSRIGLAGALEAAGRPADAERELLAAASLFPQSGRVFYELGRFYESRARYTEAIAAFETSRALGPIVGRDHLHQTLAGHYVNKADFDAAAAAHVDRIEVNPNHPEGHRQLAEIYFLQGRDIEALAEFAATAFLAVADPRAYIGAGQVYLRTGEPASAAAALERAMDLGADDSRTRYLLGQALVRAGRAEEARVHFTASQRLQTEAIAAGREEFLRRGLHRAADRALAEGRYDEAIAAFEPLIAARAIDLTEDVHRRLADAYDKQGRGQDAAQHRAAAERLRAERRRRQIAELIGTP